MSIAVIGPRSFVTCFELIGAHGFYAEDGEQVARVLRSIIEEDQFKLIIMPERFAEETLPLRERTMEQGRISPVFVIIPDLTMVTGPRMEELRGVVNQAVGTKVEL